MVYGDCATVTEFLHRTVNLLAGDTSDALSRRFGGM
jgi:hypothetical protein